MQARTHAGAGRAALREGMASNKRELADCVCSRVCWSRVILFPIPDQRSAEGYECLHTVEDREPLHGNDYYCSLGYAIYTYVAR